VAPAIKTATASDQDKTIATIVLAFATDPMARWSYPDPHAYLKHFPALVRAMAGKAFERGTAYYVEGFPGAALWLPPHVEPAMDELMALAQRTVREQIHGDMMSVVEQMGRYHPAEPHWYLPMIGVDPSRQGKGYGSALLEHALVACDRKNEPAYLESSNPRNVPLYERHGFQLLGKIQVGSSPTMFPMLRKPRSRF